MKITALCWTHDFLNDLQCSVLPYLSSNMFTFSTNTPKSDGNVTTQTSLLLNYFNFLPLVTAASPLLIPALCGVLVKKLIFFLT